MPTSGVSPIVSRMESYRTVREYRSVLRTSDRRLRPVHLGKATSLDGRSFTFSMSASTSILIGDLVAVVHADGRRLVGQVRERSAAGGQGVVLSSEGGPFDDAAVEPATPEETARVLGEPDLVIGTTRSGSQVAASLIGGAFNRHTFLCGQSGSGKTYTLGAILERILVGTSLPLVIVDPNADFVGLGRLRDDATGPIAEALRDVGPGVRSFGIGRDADRLTLRYRELKRAVAAAVLRLDPAIDREEFNELIRLPDGVASSPQEITAVMRAAGRPALDALAARIENLGVLDWDIWAWGGASVLDTIASPSTRATVLDLSGAGGTAERATAALAVLDHLWTHREERRPMLIVIDEAHNVCSAAPTDPVQALATERLIDIAAEGRKYGLWLLLSTQRPSKIHPQVLSQCDNLVVMRMNAQADLQQLGDAFGFAPPAMLAQAVTFRKGEALLAGGFVNIPMTVQVGVRHTVEGGSDVAVPR